MAPFQRGAQRLLPLGRVSDIPSQELQPPFESLQHCRGPEQAHPGGSQLDGQWQAVESPTRRRYLGGIAGVESEARLHCLRSFDE